MDSIGNLMRASKSESDINVGDYAPQVKYAIGFQDAPVSFRKKYAKCGVYRRNLWDILGITEAGVFT